VDPKAARDPYAKLGIPLHETCARLAGVAVDAVFDSVSVATTFKDKLGKAGVIFCSFSDARFAIILTLVEALPGHGRAPRATTTLRAAELRQYSPTASFVYVPRGVPLPDGICRPTSASMPAQDRDSSKRTLIIAAEGASVSYLEGCNPLPCVTKISFHAAVVELVALDGRADQIFHGNRTGTPGDENGGRRHLQLRHQAG